MFTIGVKVRLLGIQQMALRRGMHLVLVVQSEYNHSTLPTLVPAIHGTNGMLLLRFKVECAQIHKLISFWLQIVGMRFHSMIVAVARCLNWSSYTPTVPMLHPMYQSTCHPPTAIGFSVEITHSQSTKHQRFLGTKLEHPLPMRGRFKSTQTAVSVLIHF